MYRHGGGYFVKPPEYLPFSGEYLYSHHSTDIAEAMRAVLIREEAASGIMVKNPIFIPQKIVFSVSEKAETIIAKLKSAPLKFQRLLQDSSSRTEMVATFIAVLELCKMGSISLLDEEDDITITFTGNYEDVTDDLGDDIAE